MALDAKVALDTDLLAALADRGYYNAQQILACEQAGIIPLVLKPLTEQQGRRALRQAGLHLQTSAQCLPLPSRRTRHASLYQRRKRPDAAQVLVVRRPDCSMRDRCTTMRSRRISRWEREHVLEAMQLRLDARPQIAVVRRQTVEHVFGTLKAWQGTTPLLTKTSPKVRAEISLAVPAYNMKRIIKIIGMPGMLRAIAA